MSHARLRKDDPVYYKCALQGLIAEAKENGLEISVGENREGIKVYFRADNGECAGATIIKK